MLKFCCNGFQCSLPPLVRSILPYSTDAAHSMVEYLVKSLGFSSEEAISTSTKVSRLKSEKNADSLIEFLNQHGLDNNQIKNFISSVPSSLNSNVDKTLKPKIRVFQDLGLSGTDLVDFIASNPYITERGLDSHILPSVDFLKLILGTDANVIKAIKRANWLLSGSTPKRMRENVASLQKYGLSHERIQKLILLNPRFLHYTTSRIEESLITVEEMLGIPPESTIFIYAVQMTASFSREALKLKYEIFKSCGWSELDVRAMARKLPSILGLSESTIRSRVNFFMKELGYEAGYIASRPTLLMFSMDKRVLPRNAVLLFLKERELKTRNPSLYTVLHLTESQFLNRFVLPYKDVFPQLREAYISNKMDLLVEGAI
ncbi:hypothetical protein Nepgr_011175 [Nepenthes gracilis]|uniref:Uncharacterized protein n=1 Tax=Nepenthes gracilis TaxID=150966 RepID=A0AAD3SEQ8_NEPGR|nr:hypothetical protein Nepgr_011175 [Nepenthes gracilis]